jgi:holliday junction DNA helicase RuvA
MIDYVRGSVRQVAESHVVLDVGGIGLRVQATPATVADLDLGEVAQIATSLIVREDSWTLFGFTDPDERDVFELVQTVSGVGPRTAQALVGTLTAEGLRRAVHRQDAATVMKVPGIGRKGAQRILLELADRIGAPVATAEGSASPPTDRSEPEAWRAAVVSGLSSLGWSQREAEAAASAIEARVPDMTAADGSPDVAALLRAALRELRR